MNNDRKQTNSIVVGMLVSIIVATLIAIRVMDGDIYTQLTLREFLSSPENLLFIIYYGSVIFSAWVMRGLNNKSFLIIYALVLTVHYLFYWESLEAFLGENKNVYAFNWVGTIAAMIVMLVCQYREKVTFYVLVLAHYWKISRSHTRSALDSLTTTNFEFEVIRVVTYIFVFEFLFSVYLTCYALVMGVPHDGSILNTMTLNNHFIPFGYYYSIEMLLTFWLAYIFVRSALKDRYDPDNNNFELTEESKQKLLEKLRKQNKRKFKSGL